MGNKLSFFKKIFTFFSDCISFNTPKVIVFNILIIFLTLILIPTNYLTKGPPICIFRTIILPLIFRGNCPTEGLFANCECPACGLTRALSSLLHGNLSAAVEYNKLIIPIFLIMCFILIFNVIKIIKNR
jgi:hypothetical protein